MQFRIDAMFEDREFKRGIRRAERAGADFRPAFEQLGVYMVGSVTRNFEAQGRPDPWQGLAFATLMARAGGVSRAFKKTARKKREYEARDLTRRAASRMGSAKILMDKLLLLRSITHRASSDGCKVGTNKVQARILQEGGKAGRGHAVTIPPRKYLLVQDEDVPVIKEIMLDHVAKELA